MMRVPHGSLAKSKPQREHGRHIFAYCNVSTNQVLYSLTQVLRGNSSLKQLPDAGANNNPPKLRKDLWRPLWTVTLPDGQDGLAQGLNAFKKLREYRKQHELNWEAPPELARPTTEEEIEEIKRQLEERGGKKTETAYDIIKRRKKKIRQRMVMDQKANSIADLAAVLIAQDSIGAATADNKDVSLREERDNEVLEMIRLAGEAREGGLEKLDDQIEALRSQRQAKKEGKTDEEKSNRSMTRAIHALEKQSRRMQFAANAVAAAQEGTTWLPNNEMTAREADEAMWLQVRLLREQIQARRDAETTTDAELGATSEPILNELAPEEDIVAPEADAASDIASTEDVKARPRMFRLSTKGKALELEMIRRLHGRPERIAKALDAYKARPRDVLQLRNLATHWESMLRKVLERYEAQLQNWQSLQAAVDSGEAALRDFISSSGNKRYREMPEENVDLAAFQRRSPTRRAQIQAMEEGILFLNDLVRLISESPDVAETEARIQEYKASNPLRQPEFVLQPSERGLKSHLNVLGADRAYATVLAKAKVEVRAAELTQELERGVENANEELIESEAALEAEEAAPDEVDAQSEQLSEPTREELSEAVKQIRRLSARIHDAENPQAYEKAVQRLSQGKSLDVELKPAWTNLKTEEKVRRYTEYLTELKHGLPALRRARALLAEPDGVYRVSKAAEAARERSVAARSTGEDEVVLQQRFAAKMYERVATLREYEDVILQAPEQEIEEHTRDVEVTAPEEQGATAEAQQPGASQDAEQSSESDDQPAARPDVDYHALLPSFPEKTTLPKNRKTRQHLLELRRPIYTAGVTVKWNNMLDAEYAESWPQDVVHEPMGLTRHTAPRPTQEAIADVAEFKNQPGGGYKGKRWERGVEKREVRERVRGVTERVLEAVVRREGTERREARERREAERDAEWAGFNVRRAEVGEGLQEGEKPAAS